MGDVIENRKQSTDYREFLFSVLCSLYSVKATERSEVMARILVCDDAVFMRMTIKEMLTSSGHEVVAEAEDTDEALDMYKKVMPDIVTMDLLMKHSGVEGVKKIKEFDPKAKIIIVSVLAEQEAEVVEAVRQGAEGIVTKPIKRETLVAEVNRVLGAR